MKVTFAFLVFLLVLCADASTAQQVPEMAAMPGPYTGEIHSLIELDGGNILLGSGSNYFESGDGGNSWIPVDTGLPAVNRFARVGGTLFAMTASGLYRSTVGGASWELAGLHGYEIRSFTVTTDGVMYAGTRQLGVRTSSDQGQTWHTENLGLARHGPKINQYYPITALIEAADGSVVATTGADPDLDGGMGIYRMGPDSIRWAHVHETGVTLTDLASLPNGRLVAAGVDNAWEQGRMFASDDDGVTWQAAADLSAWFLVRDDADIVAAGSGGIFRSPDGNDWQLIALAGAEASVVLRLTAGRWIAGTRTFCSPTDNVDDPVPCRRRIGVIVEHEDGSWRQTGLFRAPARALASQEGSVYAGTEDGVFFSNDFGESWRFAGWSGGSIHVLYAEPDGSLLAGYGADTVVRRGPGAVSWEPLGRVNGRVHALRRHVDESLLAGVDPGPAEIEPGIYRYENLSQQWDLLFGVDGRVSSIAGDGTGRLYAGTTTSEESAERGQGVFVSDDSGETWQPANAGLTSSDVNDLYVDRYGRVYAATSSGLFFSDDAGGVWQSLEFAAGDIRAVVTAGDAVFAADENTTLYSPERGDAFVPLSGQMTGAVTYDLHFADGFLWAATNQGVFRSSDMFGVSRQSDRPNQAHLMVMTYPNPAVGLFSIDFTLSLPAEVQLAMYDLLGRETAVLHRGFTGDGRRRIDVDASHLSAGIYFIRLETSEGSAFSKVVVGK